MFCGVTYLQSSVVCKVRDMYFMLQFDEEDIEEDTPLEKKKKIFTKECKIWYNYSFIFGLA